MPIAQPAPAYRAQGELGVDTVGPHSAPYFNGYLKFLADSRFEIFSTERRAHARGVYIQRLDLRYGSAILGRGRTFMARLQF
jgi:hypothetical protein